LPPARRRYNAGKGTGEEYAVAGVSQTTYEQAVELVRAYVAATVGRAPSGRRFTTHQFIRALRQDPAAEAAYQQALAVLAATPGWSHAAAQMLHGQVIPELLRASPEVRFAGFAHDAPAAEDDGTAVPSYWRKS
jgi:hypothetical protein